MATLLDLAARLQKKIDQLEEFGNAVAKETAIAVVAELAHHTPVDVGQHVSGWRVGVGRLPADAPVRPHSPGVAGSTRSQNIAATIQSAHDALAAKKPGQTIYISNSAPAIEQLNAGKSSQEPAGFVERALLVGKLRAKRIRTRK